MNKLIIGFTAIVAVFLLFGCLPVAGSYYKPTAEGGAHTAVMCGELTTFGNIQFTFKEVDIIVGSDGSSLFLRVSVPEGHVALFTDDSFVKYSGEEAETVTFGDFSYYDSNIKDYVEVPRGEKFIGARENFALGTHAPRTFETYPVNYSNAAEGDFEIVLPSINVDGQVFVIPRIYFHKSVGFGIMPVNC